MRRVVVPAAMLALLAGCGEHLTRPPPPPAKPAATLTVTLDYGSRLVFSGRVAPRQSVLGALERAANVQTTYGGRFVASINGVSSDPASGQDWLYFVNGVEADVGSADFTLRQSDSAWWDYRAWGGGYVHVPAVVGAWPEPFVHGYRQPPPRVWADPPLAAVLRRVGVRVAQRPSAWRVLIGADATLRSRDPDWARAEAAPQQYGLTAWISSGVVYVWDAKRGQPRMLSAARSVIAAAATSGGGVVLVVSGTDAAAAERAAGVLASDPALVWHRYAVALDAAGRVVAAGGA